jgi:hypothetical protein
MKIFYNNNYSYIFLINKWTNFSGEKNGQKSIFELKFFVKENVLKKRNKKIEKNIGWKKVERIFYF